MKCWSNWKSFSSAIFASCKVRVFIVFWLVCLSVLLIVVVVMFLMINWDFIVSLKFCLICLRLIKLIGCCCFVIKLRCVESLKICLRASIATAISIRYYCIMLCCCVSSSREIWKSLLCCCWRCCIFLCVWIVCFEVWTFRELSTLFCLIFRAIRVSMFDELGVLCVVCWVKGVCLFLCLVDKCVWCVRLCEEMIVVISSRRRRRIFSVERSSVVNVFILFYIVIMLFIFFLFIWNKDFCIFFLCILVCSYI